MFSCRSITAVPCYLAGIHLLLTQYKQLAIRINAIDYILLDVLH